MKQLPQTHTTDAMSHSSQPGSPGGFAPQDIPFNPRLHDPLFTDTKLPSRASNTFQSLQDGSSRHSHYSNSDDDSDTIASPSFTSMTETFTLPNDNFTSYDIPLTDRPPDGSDQFCKDLPSINTTNFINDTITYESSRDYNYNNTGDDPTNNVMPNGFFFGRKSIPDLSLEMAGKTADLLDDEDDMEDEGISEFYRPSGDPDMWVRQSNRSNFKPSPDVTPRHVISKRIGNIGVIGQNIGLGHRLGVLSDDATLIPRPVTLESTSYVITEDCPLQADVRWSKPANASVFATLIYNIEVKLPDNMDSWQDLASVRYPTFRIYHTDDKMFIGKHNITRRDYDVFLKLRVRCHGELLAPDATRYWTASSFSKEAEVTFVGYKSMPASMPSTNL